MCASTHRSRTATIASSIAAVGAAPILTHNRAFYKARHSMNYWPLLGIAVVVLGFALRLNPALTVVAAGIVSGLLSGLSFADLLTLLGKSFVANRTLLLFVLTLPTIGLLESPYAVKL